MKIFLTSLILLSPLLFSSCGDMSNRSNEEHTNYTDSAGVNPDQAGNPNTSTAPIRDSFNTGATNNTSGPDNAVPKTSAEDSAKSLNNTR